MKTVGPGEGEIGNIHCPVCGSTHVKKVVSTGLCKVISCGFCTHEYTHSALIFNPELYSDEYFVESHKNWFANPNLELFEFLHNKISFNINTNKPSGSIRLLDVGCGKGALLAYFASKDCYSLTGIDICDPDPGLPQSVTTHKIGVEDYRPVELFDVVVSTLAIEHVSDPEKMIRNIFSFLKPGGIALIVTNDVGTPLYKVARFLNFLGYIPPYERLFHPHHINHFKRKSLRLISNKAGFVFLSVDGIDVPLRCLDIPGISGFTRAINTAAVSTLFSIGKLTGRRFLQVQAYLRK